MPISHAHWSPYGTYSVKVYDRLQAMLEAAEPWEAMKPHWAEVQRLAGRFGYLDAVTAVLLGSEFPNLEGNFYFQFSERSETFMRGGARNSASAHRVASALTESREAYTDAFERRFRDLDAVTSALETPNDQTA